MRLPSLSRLTVIAAYGAALCAAAAWLVRPDNQLGRTRPTTVWASAAIALAAIAIGVGAARARRHPQSSAPAIIGAALALLAALGALVFLTTLPYGN
jgi:hypothetical protein